MVAGGSARRVLVTGANGFTGRYVVQELAEHGWQVWAHGSADASGAARQALAPWVEAARWQVADLADAPALARAVQAARPHAVVHLAAVAFVGHEDADSFYNVNLLGTRHLLEALAAHAPDVGCVLLVSSANVYGNAASGELAETLAPAPANDYAVSKLAMEQMARLWLGRLPICLVRPFNYTGVGQSASFLVPKIVNHFRRRAPTLELGNLEVWRDFSDVRWVAQIYRQLLAHAPVGQVLNVGSGRARSLREVVEIAQTLSGHRLEVAVNPRFVRADEVRTLCADVSRLRALVGAEAAEGVPLEDTIGWMLGADAPAA